MAEFEKFIRDNGNSKKHRILPCCHSTMASNFAKILTHGMFKTELCDVLNEQLLFFFYGRASYRLNVAERAAALAGSQPVCCVIDYDKIPISGLAGFDTGAWDKIKEHVVMYDEQKREDFFLQDIDAARCLIDYFFVDNERYCSGEAVHRHPTEFGAYYDAESYSRIINHTVSDPDKVGPSLDNRIRTIEVRTTSTVDFREILRMIILPTQFITREPFKEMILDFEKKGVAVVTYKAMDFPARDQHKPINDIIYKHLEKNGYWSSLANVEKGEDKTL